MTSERIIDAHINVASKYFIPQKFIDDTAGNMKARMSVYNKSLNGERLSKMVNDIYTDDQADRLVDEMNLSNITSGVLLAPDFTQTTECETSYDVVIDLHREIMRRHPGRFFSLCGADPRNGPEGLERFRRAIEDYGFSGLKLYPPSGYSPSDKGLYPYYEICAANKVPVLTHTGPGWHSLDFNLGHPQHVDEASRDFPGVNFILGHGGINHVDTATYLCAYRENVYMDISGFTAVNSPDGWAAHLNRLFRTGINHKIVFGTSWPAYKMSAGTKTLVKEFGKEGPVFNGIKDKDRNLIMSDNIEDLLLGRRV